jgi:hypothetical protein
MAKHGTVQRVDRLPQSLVTIGQGARFFDEVHQTIALFGGGIIAQRAQQPTAQRQTNIGRRTQSESDGGAKIVKGETGGIGMEQATAVACVGTLASDGSDPLQYVFEGHPFILA